MTEILEVASWRQKSAMEISQNRAHHPAQNIIQKKTKTKTSNRNINKRTKRNIIYKKRDSNKEPAQIRKLQRKSQWDRKRGIFQQKTPPNRVISPYRNNTKGRYPPKKSQQQQYKQKGQRQKQMKGHNQRETWIIERNW